LLSIYEITFMITNVFRTYIIYKMMRIFFDHLRSDKKIEIISYIGYYLVNSSVFLLARIPPVLLSSNIILFFSLTLNYHATLKRRLFCAFLAYMILMCVEVFVVIITGSLAPSFLENSQYDSVAGLIIINLTSFLAVSLLSGVKNVRKEIPVPNF